MLAGVDAPDTSSRKPSLELDLPGSTLDTRQQQRDPNQIDIKAKTIRLQVAWDDGTIAQEGNLACVALLLDLIEGCLAYCWESGSGLSLIAFDLL